MQQTVQAKRAAETQFDRWALSYDRSRLNELVFFPSIRACRREIARWNSQRGMRPYRLLDVGCGTGTLLSLMSRDPQAERLIGLDYAREMVARAAEKFARSESRGRLHVVRGDAERLPFPSAAFDVVTCCNSFHHYPHQSAAVCEFHRVLRPGGMLILIDGFRDNAFGWLIFDLIVATAERNVHHASWKEIRRLIGDAGFRGLQQRKMNVFAPLLINVAER